MTLLRRKHGTHGDHHHCERRIAALERQLERERRNIQAIAADLDSARERAQQYAERLANGGAG